MEYFIISEGYLWDTVLEILKEKAAAGVDVRLIYDDFGCVTTLPYQYYKSLQQMGIKCAAFNQFRPVLNVILNNRDHRKIAVIDGHTAFTAALILRTNTLTARSGSATGRIPESVCMVRRYGVLR